MIGHQRLKTPVIGGDYVLQGIVRLARRMFWENERSIVLSRVFTKPESNNFGLTYVSDMLVYIYELALINSWPFTAGEIIKCYNFGSFCAQIDNLFNIYGQKKMVIHVA